MNAVGFTGSKRNWFVFVGDDWSHRAQRYMSKSRRIDERANRYQESVIDPQSGVEIHHCDEPLTGHRGHGSAKTALTPRTLRATADVSRGSLTG